MLPDLIEPVEKAQTINVSAGLRRVNCETSKRLRCDSMRGDQVEERRIWSCHGTTGQRPPRNVARTGDPLSVRIPADPIPFIIRKRHLPLAGRPILSRGSAQIGFPSSRPSRGFSVSGERIFVHHRVPMFGTFAVRQSPGGKESVDNIDAQGARISGQKPKIPIVLNANAGSALWKENARESRFFFNDQSRTNRHGNL
ncbi:hypothetical protein [Monaibacterium marinum]|uniref:hypothetical protein n=1 Tax=Pontivivens marinum TaxID=1690039 RepID=UPI0011AF8E92|nr:hypothetical protein [Monaibacterium marinum]